MKIIEAKKIKFKELACGDVFRYDNTIYMRIVQYVDEYPNVVDLESGDVHCCDDDEWVIPIPNAKLSLY